jgi:hypothetical protein
MLNILLAKLIFFYFKNECPGILVLLTHLPSRKVKCIFLTIEYIELVKSVVATKTVNSIMVKDSTAKINNVFCISKSASGQISKNVVPEIFIYKCIFQSRTTGIDLKSITMFYKSHFK